MQSTTGRHAQDHNVAVRRRKVGDAQRGCKHARACTLRPRVAASRAAPAPVEPPPMTSRSNSSPAFNCFMHSSRGGSPASAGCARPALGFDDDARRVLAQRTRTSCPHPPGPHTPASARAVSRVTPARAAGARSNDSIIVDGWCRLVPPTESHTTKLALQAATSKIALLSPFVASMFVAK